MKFVLIYFLAFCIFQNAFAGKLDDQLDEIYNNGVKKVNDEIANPILADIQNSIDIADANSNKASDCYENAKSSMQTHVESVTYKLDRCRAAGRGIRNVEIARKCSGIEISRFEKHANEVGSSAKTCINSPDN